MSKNDQELMDESMMKRSGHVSSKDPLVEFIYALLRDELPADKMEAIVRKIEENPDEEITFTNGWLAKYSKDLALRIQEIGNGRREGKEKATQ